MGTLIRRIEKEFVLGAVSDKEMELEITANKIKATCKITKIGDEYLMLQVNGDTIEKERQSVFLVGEKLGAYFSYFGHVMTFTATIREVDVDVLRIDFPEALYKNLSRKYTRVSAPINSMVSFSLQDTQIDLSFPKSEEYDPVDVPDLAKTHDAKNMELLVETFREKVKRWASVNTLTMFRDRSPRGFEESIIARTGKILFIPDTSGSFPGDNSEFGERIITRELLLSDSVMLPGNAGDSHDRIASFLSKKYERGVHAEIFCPILYRQYTAGYIYIAQDQDKVERFDQNLLDFIYQFSKIIAYSLKINGYFDDVLPEENDYEGAIVDISASGILFNNESEKLRTKLALFTDLDLVLKFGDRTLRVVGRIMRKAQLDGTTLYGVQFMQVKPEDFRFLFEYVYGRVVSSEDEAMWEGGSEPPELDL